MKLKENSKAVKIQLGVLSLLNFFNLKYGPEKIDTILFLEEIGNYSKHPNGKIREEALKFLVIAAKWKENTKSVKEIARGVLQPAQYKLLLKMLDEMKSIINPDLSTYLEDSDDDAWYNQEGEKIDRNAILESKFKDEEVYFKYNATFVRNSTRIYSWVERISKIDDIIFDCVSNKIVEEELIYLCDFIAHMLCSDNLNVLIKTQKLLQFLILKFKEGMTLHILRILDSIVKSMSTNQPKYLIEVTKVFFYLSKYSMDQIVYLDFLSECILVSQSTLTSKTFLRKNDRNYYVLKICIETLQTFIDETKPDIE